MFLYMTMLLTASSEREVLSVIEIKDENSRSYISGYVSDMGPGVGIESEAKWEKLIINPTLDSCLWSSSKAPSEGGILLYKRGPVGSDCAFQSKVMEAGKFKASAVLVANYEETMFNMAGNGTWFSNIPAVMITQSSADALVEASRTRQVQLKM